MKIEQFISANKHPETPSLPKEKIVAAENGVEWIGRERVVKVFRQRRPKSADHYLKPVGL